MNEEFKTDIESRITSYLDAIEASAGTAGEFVAEQTPLVAQEYLAWLFWGSVMKSAGLGVAFLLLSIVIYVAVRCMKKHEVWEVSPFLAFPIFGLIFSSFELVRGLIQVVKVIVAPRVVLLEKVAELLP